MSLSRLSNEKRNQEKAPYPDLLAVILGPEDYMRRGDVHGAQRRQVAAPSIRQLHFLHLKTGDVQMKRPQIKFLKNSFSPRRRPLHPFLVVTRLRETRHIGFGDHLPPRFSMVE